MYKLVAILLAFLVMGVADAMGPMSKAVEANFKLSRLMATLLPFFVFIAFAVFSVPGGLLAARIGKKRLLLLGLALNAAAMLVPTVMEPGFPLLLACIFVLGIGTTLLQVAGNPIMRDISAEGAYGRNLALAQGAKGLGSASMSFLAVAGISLGSFLGGGEASAPPADPSAAVAETEELALDPAVVTDQTEPTSPESDASGSWRDVFPIYFGLMALALAAVAIVPVTETPPDSPPSIGDSLALLREPVFATAVLGIFLYVGAEVCMGTFVAPALERVGLSSRDAALYGPAMFLGLVAAGRLTGSAILNVITPVTCFRLSAVLGLVGAALFIFGSKPLALAGVVCTGLGFANIWPMLFSITVEHRPERANELSGLMCMAISGGAIVPLVMGKMIDLQWESKAFIVPVACFAYLTLLSLGQKQPRSSTAT